MTGAESDDGPTDAPPETEPDAETADADTGVPDADGERPTDDRTTIRTGRDFEREYRLNAEAAGEFLVALGEQLQDDDELTLSTEEWELPFAFGEPIDLEVDFEGVGDPSLEVEVTLPGRVDDDAPVVL